jgi:hypothetical protein
MTTYKITKNAGEAAEKYYKDLMQAMDVKELLKKKRKDGEMFHIFGMVPGNEKWFKLE